MICCLQWEISQTGLKGKEKIMLVCYFEMKLFEHVSASKISTTYNFLTYSHAVKALIRILNFILFIERLCFYEWFSRCPSARLSVCHTILTMFPSSYHHEIFSWVITISRMWCPCKRSRWNVKVTEVKTNFASIWAFPDHNPSLNTQMAMKWCTKLELA